MGYTVILLMLVRNHYRLFLECPQGKTADQNRSKDHQNAREPSNRKHKGKRSGTINPSLRAFLWSQDRAPKMEMHLKEVVLMCHLLALNRIL